MNIRQYLESVFTADVIKPEELEDILDPFSIEEETIRSILSKMPLDSIYGNDCKTAIDNAKAFMIDIAKAYGVEDHKMYHRCRVVRALVDVLGCYIRG